MDKLNLVWSHLEYSVYVKCVCGSEINLWDADAKDDQRHIVVCDCGKKYEMVVEVREA